jgi:predicted SprT family Zn-dependent metalloprotease
MASIKQLCFGFLQPLVRRLNPAPVVEEVEIVPETNASENARDGRDAALEKDSRQWLLALGLKDGAKKLSVVWNPRLRSTAGYARWPKWIVELNPRLREIEGETERTLKHELAHLIAYERAGRRRIEPHGAQWRKACADLGIPDESARHTLPLPRTKQTRRLTYACPSCGHEIPRVHKFKRPTACLACCRAHNRGKFDPRFRLVLKTTPDQTGRPSSSV